jgi:hypothetical protein
MQLAATDLPAFLGQGVTCPHCSSKLSSKDGSWKEYPESAYLEGVYELRCPGCQRTHRLPIKKAG